MRWAGRGGRGLRHLCQRATLGWGKTVVGSFGLAILLLAAVFPVFAFGYPAPSSTVTMTPSLIASQSVPISVYSTDTITVSLSSASVSALASAVVNGMKNSTQSIDATLYPQGVIAVDPWSTAGLSPGWQGVLAVSFMACVGWGAARAFYSRR